MVPTHKHRWGVGTRKGEGELGRLTRLAFRFDLRYLSNSILHPGVERRQELGEVAPLRFCHIATYRPHVVRCTVGLYME